MLHKTGYETATSNTSTSLTGLISNLRLSLIPSIILSALWFINEKSKEYERLNIGRIGSKTIKEELLLNNPKLYKTPIVRNGRQATVGYKPEIWKDWE